MTGIFAHGAERIPGEPAKLDPPSPSTYNRTMAQLHVALSADLEHYVDRRVAAGGYADPAAFLRDLVERDQHIYEADVRRVRALIQEGIDSGVLDATPEEVLDDIIAGISQQDG